MGKRMRPNSRGVLMARPPSPEAQLEPHVVKGGKPNRWNCGPEFQQSAMLAAQDLATRFWRLWREDLSLLRHHLPVPVGVGVACSGGVMFKVTGTAACAC